MKNINTVGELRDLLSLCEDDEPLNCYLTMSSPLYGEVNDSIKCTGASSTAGGRAVNLYFERND